MEQMSPTEYTQSIASYKANGKVVACAYTKEGKFGYFICEEQYDEKHQKYVYTNVSQFIPRINNKSYQDALKALTSN
jgi:hypothetical protein